MLLCRIDRHPGSGQLQSPTTLLKAKRVARKLFKGSWVPLGENKIESFTMASHMGTLSLGHMIPDNLNDTTIGEFLCKSWTSSTFESKLRRTHAVLLTHYLLWFLGVLLIYLTDHVILPQDTPTRYFKQHTAAQTFGRSSSRPACMMDSVSKWWERVILFVWHAFLFKFLSLKSHLRLPVFSGYKKLCKSTAAYVGLLPWPTHVLC